MVVQCKIIGKLKNINCLEDKKMKKFLLINLLLLPAIYYLFHYLRVKYNLPSQTSMVVAFSRAVGQITPRVPEFSDPFAEAFLPSVYRFRINIERMKRRFLPALKPYPPVFRRLSVLMQYRTVVLDAAIKEHLPIEQLVILGAGLDSRAWRLKELAGVKVFEVDHPATQAWKKEQAKKIEGERQAREFEFVTVDFTKDDLSQKLEDSGFDRKKKSFWIWEGVTMYLEEGDVRKTMKMISDLSEGGGGLALTYLNTKSGEVPFAWWVSILGEPFKSAFLPHKIDELARESGGWVTESNTGVDDWNAKLTPGYELPFSLMGRGLFERIWVGVVPSRV